MDISTLTVHFRGICTHFSRIVPGVPHRAVLPDATALQFGGVDLPKPQLGTHPYVLLPHVAVLLSPDHVLEVDGLITLGVITESVRVQVTNAIGNVVKYAPDYREVAHLADFVEFFQFSDEVVLGGRARCYFDVVSGYVEPDRDENRKIAGVKITIQTDGPPVLAVSPFFQTTENIETPPGRASISSITLPRRKDVRLLVANVGPGCEDGADGFDFLLNYLTLKGGIPRRLTSVPGAVKPPARTRTEALEWLVRTELERKHQRFDFDTVLVSSTLSCSNTQYP